MKLIDRIAKRYIPGPGGFPLVEQVFWQSYGDPSHERMAPTFASYATEGYQGNAVVFAVIGRRLSLFSEATFKWQNTATKKLFGTPELSILEKPWPNGTTGELLARMIQDADLSGNSYIRDAGPRLERLRPDCIVIVTTLRIDSNGDEIRELVGYMYDPAIGGADPERSSQFFTPDELAHWSPVPDPMANFRGMSWLTPVVREINADSGLTQYKTQYLNNAATPNMLIRYDRELSDEAAKKVGAAVQAKHGGVSNAFKTLILDKGADVTVVGADLTKMDFTKVQAAGENRIAAAGGVPPIVVGLKEGLDAATYSNYGQAMRAFADLGMRPLWRSACAALETLVQVPPDCRLWFDTSDIAALLEGEKERADTFAVKSTTAETLIRAGYVPETVAAAVAAGDLGMLKHTGRIPTALYNTNDPVDPAFAKSEKFVETPIPVKSPDPNAPKPVNGQAPVKAAT